MCCEQSTPDVEDNRLKIKCRQHEIVLICEKQSEKKLQTISGADTTIDFDTELLLLLLRPLMQLYAFFLFLVGSCIFGFEMYVRYVFKCEDTVFLTYVYEMLQHNKRF